jgi:hypothetical protein
MACDTADDEEINDPHTIRQPQSENPRAEPTKEQNTERFANQQTGQNQPCCGAHSAKLNTSIQQSKKEQYHFNWVFQQMFAVI